MDLRFFTGQAVYEVYKNISMNTHLLTDFILILPSIDRISIKV